ncbi:MAG: ATP-binding cassette domain-containing protein [Acidimicrobiaceae bacterium]|nr:ATP-binding cassette domain-containing protein [Acidimicrobiaceae bacterium]MDE0606439.1 ATP-binding cassette domain-containing protein [Acidimicrobiaceae bacterium]
MSSDAMISCRDVWKLYGPDPLKFLNQHNGEPTVDAVKEAGYIPAVVAATLDVMPGEILVLMGLSGSGKSTLVRCLSRLVEPTAGSVEFGGIDLLAASGRELIDIRRHRMGMVFQHFALFPHRTVAENIAFPLEVQGVDGNTRRTRAEEIISLVGLEGRGDYYPRELSGGQQQRVGIGRSLAVEPDVWFLDEPFSALDPLIRREMQDEFLRLQSVLRKTIVFITHDFAEAIRLADRIAILYEGQIVQLGRAEELITDPATEYVRKFTRDVQRDKILTAGSVMSEPGRADLNGASVQASALLSEVAATVLSSREPVLVQDDTGTAVGSLDRDTLIDAVWGTDETGDSGDTGDSAVG